MASSLLYIYGGIDDAIEDDDDSKILQFEDEVSIQNDDSDNELDNLSECSLQMLNSNDSAITYASTIISTNKHQNERNKKNKR